MRVRIYQPAKNAMQSGQAKSESWLIESLPQSNRKPDLLMGWVSSADVQRHVRLKFKSQEDALNYAKKQGWMYDLIAPKRKTTKIKAYADNFAFDRQLRWTH